MRIAAFLGVKDEVELIGPCLAHLRAIGVDHILACDSRSTDGTREVLAAQSGGDLELIDFDDLAGERAEAALLTDIVARARAAGADRLIYADADEFWLPATGRLRDLADLAAPAQLAVARFNVVLGPAGPAIPLPAAGGAGLTPADHARILMFTAPPRPGAAAEPDWIATPPRRKLIVPPALIRTTRAGHHHAEPEPGVDLPRLAPADLVIAHVPFSSPERFARKLANIRAALDRHGHEWGPGVAAHWRAWADLDPAAEFARNRRSTDQIRALRAEGRISSAADWLARAGRAAQAAGRRQGGK